jgi:phage gp29-like protein
MFGSALTYRVQVEHPVNSLEASAPSKSKSPITYILDQQKFRTREDLRKLRVAIDNAGNPINYNREDLHRIYRECMRDSELQSQWESRKMKTKEKEFRIVSSPGAKEENKDQSQLLRTEWFIDWVDAALDSRLWGFTPIEFGPVVDNKFVPYEVNGKYYDAINVLDRDNVKPELGIITSMPGQSTGISFSDPTYTQNLMFIGRINGEPLQKWGIMYSLVKILMFKDNCLGNWSEWAEVFGMDKRIGKTDADGEDRRKFIEAIKSLGSNAYGVFTKNDEIEFMGVSRQDAYKVYHEFVKYVDEKTAKRVWGQDVVNNNTGRVVGTVGENVANMYGDNDAKFIERLVNDRLIPKMQALGIPITGIFEWDTTEKLSLKDKSEVDERISKMGFEIDETYIMDTYGVPVKKKELPEIGSDPLKTAKEIKALYAGTN